jgi:dihydroflavonol-4-reductase
MTRALVTGASGFIGGHVVRALLTEGAEVRAFVRPASGSASAAHTLEGLDVERFEGDVTDADAVRSAMADVDVVFHLAARYALHRRDSDLTKAVNVAGTRVVMEAALAASVERVVYTSSVAAVGLPTEDGTPADESVWADPCEAAGPYEASKYASERLVQRMVAQQELPAVVVNPSAPIGPLDFKPTPSGQLIVDAANGALPAYLASAGLNIVHVSDVAAGHVLAWRRGEVGQRYILGNLQGNLTLREIADRAAKVAGRRGPRRSIPYAVAMAYAQADERVLYRFRGGVVHAPIAGVRLARHRMWFDCRRAVDQLGLPQTPLNDAFADAVRFFVEQRRVRPVENR